MASPQSGRAKALLYALGGPGSNVFCAALPELEVDRFVRIFSRWRRSYDNFTTALGATGRGLQPLKKLAAAARISEDAAKEWLKRQAIWQIYLPPPRRIPRPIFGVTVPNEVHQADLLFLPHDRVGHKTYKYALTVVDAASRYKEAEPLATKEAKEVAAALEKIYRRSSLRWPKLLQVDPGREFMGTVNQVLAKHGVRVRRGRVYVYRDQGIVERFNRTLAERLFGHQYAQEMLFEQRMPGGHAGKRSTEWVARLSAVIAALKTR